jgi:RimJ/RimL family protein N-acetyltransferase
MMSVEPCTLTGQLVRLEPLALEHAQGLLTTGRERETWEYILSNPCLSLEAMQQWIAEALQQQQAKEALPFTIIERTSGHIIGTTRYLAITPENYSLEIGWTWLDPDVRRTGINTECKYLLLRHAFEELNAIRVQLKTDSRNLRSQKAIERIGGIKEGTLRNHIILPDGYYRHTIFYSIIASEWEHVKSLLEVKMNVSAFE